MFEEARSDIRNAFKLLQPTPTLKRKYVIQRYDFSMKKNYA